MESNQVIQQTIPQGLANHLKNIHAENAPQSQPQMEAETEMQPQSEQPQVEVRAEAEVNTQPQADIQPKSEPQTETNQNDDYDWLNIGNSENKREEEKPVTVSYEDKAKAFDALFSHPETELVLKAFQAGKTLADLVKEYQVVDYSSMDAQDVTKIYGEQNGYTEDQMEEWLDTLPTIQRDREIKAMRDELNAKEKDKTKNLVKGYEQSAEMESQVRQKLDHDLNKVAQAMVDKDLFGTKLTKKDADDFPSWVRTEFSKYINPDGSYNVELLRNFWLGAVKIPAIQKANYAKGKTDGTQAVLKDVHRPNLSGAAATQMPQPKSVTDPQKKAQDAAKAIGSGKLKPIISN